MKEIGDITILPGTLASWQNFVLKTELMLTYTFLCDKKKIIHLMRNTINPMDFSLQINPRQQTESKDFQRPNIPMKPFHTTENLRSRVG